MSDEYLSDRSHNRSSPASPYYLPDVEYIAPRRVAEPIDPSVAYGGCWELPNRAVPLVTVAASLGLLCAIGDREVAVAVGGLFLAVAVVYFAIRAIHRRCNS